MKTVQNSMQHKRTCSEKHGTRGT